MELVCTQGNPVHPPVFIQAMNGESSGMYIIEPTLNPIIGRNCRASQKAVSAHFTSKQILRFAFKEKHSGSENPG